MFEERKIKDLILASLVADSYCLNSHWIYDEKVLKNLNTDWEKLGKACSVWHKGKLAGEFTHYGDQINFLYQHVIEHKEFDLSKYIPYWQAKMQVYNGYIDAATRDTLVNIESGKEFPCGSASHDLSIVGRIAPLLLVSKTQEDFFVNIEKFVQVTHNSQLALDSSKFFATVLLDILNGMNIKEALITRKNDFSSDIQEYVDKGLDSVSQNSFEAIRNFGPACSINDGFSGVIHILAKYTNFKEAMINNAKAGGDNSSRAMIIALLLVAKNSAAIIPKEWTNIKIQV